MNVQELIELLEKIEDKTRVVVYNDLICDCEVGEVVLNKDGFVILY